MRLANIVFSTLLMGILNLEKRIIQKRVFLHYRLDMVLQLGILCRLLMLRELSYIS